MLNYYFQLENNDNKSSRAILNGTPFVFILYSFSKFERRELIKKIMTNDSLNSARTLHA